MPGVPLLLFPNGSFDPLRLRDARSSAVLDAAVQRFDGQVRCSDVIHAVIDVCIAGHDAGIRNVLEFALTHGTRLVDVRDVIDAYNPPGADSYGFDGSPESFSAELLDALNAFAAEFEAAPDELRDTGLELLLACVFDHPSARDREFLEILDFQEAAEALRRRVRLHTASPLSLWDEASGRLRSEEFTADAWAVLERAAERAADLGYDIVLSPHLLLSSLAESEGLADRVVRRQLPPHIEPFRVRSCYAV